MNKLRLALPAMLFVLLHLGACSNQHFYHDVETAIGTNGRVNSQHHLAAYYPSAISLNFPGYLFALEDSKPYRISRDGDVVIDNPTEAGRDIPRITDTMREYYLPFVSHIIRYEGKLYGMDNCALYSVYRNNGEAIVPFCDSVKTEIRRISSDPRSIFRHSWDAIALFREELAAQVESGRYTHLIIAMMGLDTSQEESVRNFNSMIWSIRKSAGEEFRPLFIGISWPSFFDGRWADPIWELAAYPFKADEADRLGLSWLGVLMHEAILPLSNKIPTSIISHSFGTRALSMATCVGPAIRNGELPRSYSEGQIDKLIGLGAAMSLERLRSKLIPFFEDINYPHHCEKVKTLVISTTRHDTAVTMAVWSDLAGNYEYYEPYCNGDLPYSIYCTHVDHHGDLDAPYDIGPKLLYLDTTELMRYTVPGTQGGAHSDIFRPEVGRMLWSILLNNL